MPHVKGWFTSVNHSDARQCLVLISLVKSAHVSNSVFSSIHSTFFAVILSSLSLHTHLQKPHTYNTFCGSPWRRERGHFTFTHSHTRTHARTRTHTSCFLLQWLWGSCLSWTRRTAHVHMFKTSDSTTIVLVYKYIPFFQHKVYTFLSGWCFVTHLWNDPGKNHFTLPPLQDGFP